MAFLFIEGWPDNSRDMLLGRVQKRITRKLKVAYRQLAGADMNPHAGRLRASVMPV